MIIVLMIRFMCMVLRLQNHINRDTAKYEYLTGQEILTTNQSQMIKHVKFTYSPLGKSLENQPKN